MRTCLRASRVLASLAAAAALTVGLAACSKDTEPAVTTVTAPPVITAVTATPTEEAPAPTEDAPVEEPPVEEAPVEGAAQPAGLFGNPDPAPAPVEEAPAPVPAAYYANCSAVRAAGAAPIYAGQPGYSLDLDRDGDGVACE